MVLSSSAHTFLISACLMKHPPTLTDAARAIRQGEVTPRELVDQALERIERFDDAVRAWVIVDRAGAIDAAERLTKELAAGHNRGPLHGIPIAIKDVVDVQGMPTRAGSPLTSAQPATSDATIVERLRSAGAIILGKTVTTEFACFDPSPTRNPWNLNHTPGGSSSGSAAAVAMQMCYAAIASQTGGSITRPASYCGVAGCKPTFGRTSRTGVVPVAFHLDHVGVMARTAADCALMLAAMAGDDPNDPACSPRPGIDLGASTSAGPAPRIGVLRSSFFDQADAEVARLADAALATLKQKGAELADVGLPAGFDQVHVMHRRLMAAEAADFHRRAYGAPRPGYGPEIAALLAEGFATSMTDYQEALAHQARFRHAAARTLSSLDILVTPSTPTAAPASLATTGDPRFNSPWSHSGLPTMTIPCALTAAGMPISLQLIGPAWSEARLLEIAAWCEERLTFRHTAPALRG
jgi:Asp-tRNA(Asn)/Glu-tRNA(Gln) amidotransferase A subunit family amidase